MRQHSLWWLHIIPSDIYQTTDQYISKYQVLIKYLSTFCWRSTTFCDVHSFSRLIFSHMLLNIIALFILLILLLVANFIMMNSSGRWDVHAHGFSFWTTDLDFLELIPMIQILIEQKNRNSFRQFSKRSHISRVLKRLIHMFISILWYF